MKIRAIKKHIENKKSARIKNILLGSLLAGTLLGTSAPAFADDADDAENVSDYVEDINNPYSYNTVEIDDNHVTFNGRTVSRGESISFRDAEGIRHTYYFDNYDPSGSYTFTNNRENKGGSADIFYNTITFGPSGQFVINISGGGTFSGTLGGNDITFNSGTYEFNFSDTDDYTVNIRDNTLTINGGTFRGSDNYFANSSASGNTININGGDFSGGYLLGVLFASTGADSNNTLNINTTGITARNIRGFDSLNFYLPSSTANGDVVLTLTEGATDLNNASVSAVIGGGSTLTTGDTVTLLKNSNGITSIGEMSSKFDEGVTLTYDLEMEAGSDDITLKLGAAQTNDEAALIGSGNLHSTNTISTGTDKLLEWLPPEEFEEAATESNTEAINADSMSKIASLQNGFDVFANAGASRLKTKTGNGSYMKSKGGNFDIGISRAFQNSHGMLILAPLFDYGKSSYDSYLRTGEHGSGDSHYVAGGLMLRQINTNGFYYEGSFRGGRAHTDFQSNDLYSGAQKVDVGYNASAPLFAGHVRVGKVLRMNKNNIAHVYGIYSHSHQNDMSTHLSTGEKYEFDSIDAGKFRLGYRLTTRVSPISRLYSGLAYQYEFNGETSAHYRGHDIPKSEVKGSSGMLELGWQIKPNAHVPWMVDFALNGWIGQQEGVTATAKIKKAF